MLEDVAAHPGLRVIKVTKGAVLVGRASVVPVFIWLFFFGAALVDGRAEQFRIRIRKTLIISADRPGSPGRIGKVPPSAQTIAVIDDNVRDRLPAPAQQPLKPRAVLFKGAVTVAKIEVFSGAVARAKISRV